MQAFFGLGNIGSQYDYTPHNVGFSFLDYICDLWSDCKHGVVGKVSLSDKSFFCVKPHTFMNKSGACVGPFLQKNGISGSQALVIYDDVEVALGRVRLALGGGARGHNGLRSITNSCGAEFWRLGVGVGRDPRMDLSSFVLKRMPLKDWEIVTQVFQLLTDNLEDLLAEEVNPVQFIRKINGS